MTDAPKILVTRSGPATTLTSTRPHKKNALDGEMFTAAARALREADADAETRVIVLTGAGEVFTSGADVAVFKPGGAELQGAVQLLQQLVVQDKPIIAAVDGLAVGIGTTLLLHVDYIVATARARFCLPFSQYGLVPEGGSTLLLPLLVGLQRASEWLLFGEPFDAGAAHAAGLVNTIVAPDELAAFAQARAQKLASLPATALRLSRRLLRDRHREELQKTIVAEGERFVECLSSTDTQQALAAFAMRKAPKQ